MKRVFIQWMRVKRRSTILIILMARTVIATITIPTERVAIQKMIKIIKMLFNLLIYSLDFVPVFIIFF